MKKKSFAILIALVLMIEIAPTQVSAYADNPFIAVARGHYTSYALQKDGTLWEWGDSCLPDIRVDDDRPFNKPHIVMNSVKEISAGWDHAVALKYDGSVWAWGANYFGQLGTQAGIHDGSSTIETVWYPPVKVMDNVIHVSVNDCKSSAVTLNGDLYVWGMVGSYSPAPTPQKIAENVKTAEINSLGYALILYNNGVLELRHSDYQNGETIAIDNIAQIAVSSGYAALDSRGDVYVWHIAGYMGGTSNENPVIYEKPTIIASDAKYIAMFNGFLFIIKNDGSLWTIMGMFGYASGGSLNHETGEITGWTFIYDDYIELPLRLLDNCSAAVFDGVGLAVTDDGSVWSWGEEWGGELGMRFSGILTYEERMTETDPKVNPVLVLTAEGEWVGVIPGTEKPSSWALDQVNAAIAAGLVPQSIQFRYLHTITRAEYCALAVALYEKHTGKEISGRKTFNDTKDINVEKTAAIGIVTGTGKNQFDPNASLTREQAAVMLSRLAEAVGKPLASDSAAFTDNGEIASWAIEQVGQVQAAGIMGGVGNNTFAPKDPYTREQSIITMIRLWDIVEP